MSDAFRVPGSFRDPSGWLFFLHGKLYRQVNKCYKEHYDMLMNSGLYSELVKRGMLISHADVDTICFEEKQFYKTIQPRAIPFVSYPYEWAFSQLRDAALLTLSIQKQALQFGMCLKDASAYNIQFIGSKPIFVDTLSFEKYQEGRPWAGYKQFCQHFLAPLALMAYRDDRLNSLLKTYIDGIPLDLANSLLPIHSKINRSIIFHISLHSRMQKKYSDKPMDKAKLNHSLSKNHLLGLISSLERAIRTLRHPLRETEWKNYYSQNCNYNDQSFDQKKELVKKYIEMVRPNVVWDIGANVGAFSDLASDKQIFTVAFDIDNSCVEQNYKRLASCNEHYQLPLVLDITNPSPGIGWASSERMSLLERGPADLIFALALIHHLAISNNVPLVDIARLFSKLCRYIVLEFVPKEDSQVRRLLASREDIFPDYNRESFEKAFGMFFKIIEFSPVGGSERLIYLMKNQGEEV